MTELHEIRIGDVVIGGPLGSRTGMLVGSIFYDRHSIVTDAFAGDFDRERAGALLDRVTGLSQRYGVQMAVDVIATSARAIERFLPFVSARTHLPMMINAAEGEVRVAGLEAAGDLGVLDRCIFASLSSRTEDFELDALRTHRPAAVMILANDGITPTPDASCEMIDRCFRPMLDEIGVEAPIVDAGTVDPPSVGINLRTIQAVRERYGYPAGCAFFNCFPRWTGLRELGREWVDLSLGVALVACRGAGADFLHYGLIERAPVAAHAAATAEVFFGSAALQVDGHRLPEGHALDKMLEPPHERLGGGPP